jgi:carnitine 3-dehydrogenase
MSEPGRRDDATSPPDGDLPTLVALLGGGVIGGGWAARFVLNGVDVRLFDPDPEAARRVRELLDLAREALSSLVLAPLPPEGRLSVVRSIEDAVREADFVQESAPEREDLKREVLRAADAAASPATVLASSTSGLLPTRLAAGLRHPERLCAGHPFNPVYLLPLVEVVRGRETSPATLARAAGVYRCVGMHPLTLHQEVDGFVADRLLEALWREALWLVHDGVATVAEVDDAIRYGAGLRWAAMGTFLTYRIAGGEAGMRHFMAQFGPALQWPWSRLTDVPELTDDLLEKLAAQSDAQADGRQLRDLERIRDRCLVAVLQGLRSESYGAGATVAAHERRLLARTRGAAAAPPADGPHDGQATGPMRVHRTRIPASWIDYNGHVHESRYLQVFGDATDALLARLGAGPDYLETGFSFYTVETRLVFRAALAAGDVVDVTVQVLGADELRIHAWLELFAGGEVAATAEHLYLHVDTTAQKAVAATPHVAEQVRRLAQAHAALPRPAGAGRRVADRAPWNGVGASP